MIYRASAPPPSPTSSRAPGAPSPGDAATTTRLPPAAWQRALGHSFRRLDDLLAALDLDEVQLPDGHRWRRGEAQDEFPLKVPRPFVDRMVPGDAHDPLLRQVLPVGDEMLPSDGFVDDPLAETPASPLPGLLHKYKSRVLMVTTGACAVHCRYCFRRHFPYGDHRPEAESPNLGPWRQALDYIAGQESIDEVILSGGDPLSLSDAKLASLAEALGSIPHLRRLRLHTRLPVVLPERVDDRLLDWLGKGPLQKVMVLHINHGNEIDGNVATAAAKLRNIGVTLLNQAVLLKGVNDSVEPLVNLSRDLFEAGIMPYYLHLLDKVRGAAHFEVEDSRAQRLYREVLASLPGFLVPRLVREVPSASSKMPVPLIDC